ncbi:MAG TPA: carbamoyl phosphate synthase small subunit [Pseudogracilibacillus sp.]|nr:carbamoyl phosphate synthase small subunit [Pseudogracilibacillus sp.]
MHKRYLVLEDGAIFAGEAIGATVEAKGEVVFYNGMTGYQEMVTDPNYNGKIVVMTYPLVGNYGINRDDFESISPHIEGLIVKELSTVPSNFRSEETLDSFLTRHQIPGITGVDTRKLTRHIRKANQLRGVITDKKDISINTLFSHSDWPKRNLVEEVSITKPYIVPGHSFRITVVDLGMKHSILHELTERQCNVTVVPYNYDAESILRFKPDGVLFSNGPGNPNDYPEVVRTVRDLLGNIPIFGIGLGHQLLALATGASIERLRVGHYGKNYTVKEMATNRTWSTTQSRAFYVTEKSLDLERINITYRSGNDHTIEGISHKQYPAFSVQFNPEGAPGSKETNFLFDQFLDLIKATKKGDGDQ